MHDAGPPICPGMSPKLGLKGSSGGKESVLKDDPFMRAFTGKGRFKGFLEKIPVMVVLNDRAALLGAAFHSLELEQT